MEEEPIRESEADAEPVVGEHSSPGLGPVKRGRRLTQITLLGVRGEISAGDMGTSSAVCGCAVSGGSPLRLSVPEVRLWVAR